MTKPTHSLCMKPNDPTNRGKWSTIGVAWATKTETGTYFSISLNRGTVLHWRDCDDMKIALFEANK